VLLAVWSRLSPSTRSSTCRLLQSLRCCEVIGLVIYLPNLPRGQWLYSPILYLIATIQGSDLKAAELLTPEQLDRLA